MELLLYVANMRIELVDITTPSATIDLLYDSLLSIYDGQGGLICHNRPTDLIVMYESNIIVGGALLSVSPTTVIIKRQYTASTTSRIVSCLQDFYSNLEIHVSANIKMFPLYAEHNFIKKNRSVRCLCISRRFASHLVWSAPQQLPSPQVETIHQNGECLLAILYPSVDSILSVVILKHFSFFKFLYQRRKRYSYRTYE
jgi:hypothetical protein